MLRVSTDKHALDVALIHRFLSEESHWARGIPLAVVRRSIRHSLCFGGYVDDAQVAFARVVTDYATFGNLLDVFVLREHRGRGYAGELMRAIVSDPRLASLRRFTLATSDAHGLYERYGFATSSHPEWLMERFAPDPYRKQRAAR